MDVDTDPEFWKWLRDKSLKEANQSNELDPMPLYIQIEKPIREPALIDREETPFDSLIDYEVDYSV